MPNMDPLSSGTRFFLPTIKLLLPSVALHEKLRPLLEGLSHSIVGVLHIGWNTDHKLVKAKLQKEQFKMKISKKKEGINVDNFKDPRNEVKYQEKIKERLEEKEEGPDPGEIYKNIREALQKLLKKF